MTTDTKRAAMLDKYESVLESMKQSNTLGEGDKTHTPDNDTALDMLVYMVFHKDDADRNSFYGGIPEDFNYEQAKIDLEGLPCSK